MACYICQGQGLREILDATLQLSPSKQGVCDETTIPKPIKE